MKDRVLAIVGIVVAVVAALPSWIEFLLDRGEELEGAFLPVAIAVYPFLVAALGAFAGWRSRIWYETSSARWEFQSISLGQADMVAMAYTGRKGVMIGDNGSTYRHIVDRDDVFSLKRDGDGRCQVTLKTKWQRMMARHSDLFFKIWRPRFDEELDSAMANSAATEERWR